MKKVIITDIENFDLPVGEDVQIVGPDLGKGNLKNCIGCFCSWHKTPGECIIHDGYERTGAKLGHCDQLIFISECVYGSLSPFCKMVLDPSISYVHPNFVTRRGEMHHKRRYDNVITVTAHFYGANITEEEKKTAEKLMQSNADNYDGFVGSIHFHESVDALKEALKGVTL
ncbi:MAG: flavodoxin family protein [Firmicutes bacterium]|nr:flavodoxin family protein [Bacillota bacterium]